MESIAKALSLSSDIVFLKKVFTLFRVEKHPSASPDVIGTLIMAFNKSTVSEKVQLGYFQQEVKVMELLHSTA